MTTQHTPGPWIVGVTVDRAYGEWPVFRLRDMNDADPDGAEVQANARLIAAAPDLLAACEAARAALETCDPWTEIGPSGQGGDELGMKFDESLVEAAKVATDAAIAKAKGTP